MKYLLVIIALLVVLGCSPKYPPPGMKIIEARCEFKWTHQNSEAKSLFTYKTKRKAMLRAWSYYKFDQKKKARNRLEWKEVNY